MRVAGSGPVDEWPQKWPRGWGRTALRLTNRSEPAAKPGKGFALPAKAALDSARRPADDGLYEGEALACIARSQSPLVGLWSDFQARKQASKSS